MNTLDNALRPAITRAVTGARLLPTIVVAYALALIVYLPVEPAIIGGLPSTAYWIVRLVPDGLVVGLAIAVVLFGDRTARTPPVRLLWAVGAVCAVLVTANYVRGVSVADSFNAIRLVVRYLVLGLLVWWALLGRTGVGPLVLRAVFVAGLVQVVIATVQIVARILPSVGSATAFDPSSLLFIDGTLGRYDRLGLLLMTVVIALMATGDLASRRRYAFIAACMILLYLTTSRQAMIGLAIAGGLLFVFPLVEMRRRALAVGLAALSVLLVFAIPTRPPPATSQDPDSVGVQVPPSTSQPNPSTGKGEVKLSVDPNLNFRLFYNLTLAPWAAATEPLLGFGPLQQVADQPDPRLVARFEAAGMPWSWARLFTNDSNYASLVVQFGIIAPSLFLLLILGVAARVALKASRPAGGFARFAVLNAVAVLIAAWFGPAFEIRMIAIIFWVALMAAIAMRPGLVQAPDEHRPVPIKVPNG